jgi:hypothetical protein
VHLSLRTGLPLAAVVALATDGAAARAPPSLACPDGRASPTRSREQVCEWLVTPRFGPESRPHMSEPAAAGMAEALRLADDIVPGGQAIHLCSRQADHNLSTALVEEFLTGVMTIAHSVIVDPDAPNEAYFAVV